MWWYEFFSHLSDFCDVLVRCVSRYTSPGARFIDRGSPPFRLPIGAKEKNSSSNTQQFNFGDKGSICCLVSVAGAMLHPSEFGLLIHSWYWAPNLRNRWKSQALEISGFVAIFEYSTYPAIMPMKIQANLGIDNCYLRLESFRDWDWIWGDDSEILNLGRALGYILAFLEGQGQFFHCFNRHFAFVDQVNENPRHFAVMLQKTARVLGTKTPCQSDCANKKKVHPWT